MARHIYLSCNLFSMNIKFDLALITVEPVLFLYMFSNFLYFPTLQSLIFNKICIQKYTSSFCEALQHNETYKKEHEEEAAPVTSETSHWILKTTISLTVPSFFVVILFLGVLGDKVGRKIPVLLPCFGAFAAYVSGLLNAKFMSASLNYILIGPIINGLCGGFIACLMSVYSYVGQVSSSSSKMTRIGILESMVFLAGTLGVFFSGMMLENQGYIFTFSALCIIIGVSFIYALLWLENVQPPSTDYNSESLCRTLLRFFRESFQCVMKRRERRSFSMILLQIIAVDVLMLCTAGDMDISYLYLTESLQFSPTMFGYLKGLDNFLRGLILIVFLPLMRKLTSIRDLPLVMFGLLSYAGAFLILGCAKNKWMVFLGAAVGMFKGIPSAGLRSTMSSMVTKHEQGRLFGLVAASESVISLLASVLFNELYPATLDIFPGLCYVLAAGLIVIVFLVIMYVHCALPENVSLPEYGPIDENVTDDDSVVNRNGDVIFDGAENDRATPQV